MTEQRQRNILSLAERVQVINEYESMFPKPKFQALANKYRVSGTQIRSILLNQVPIINAYKELHPNVNQEQLEKDLRQAINDKAPALTDGKNRNILSLATRVKVIHEYTSQEPPPTFNALAIKYKVSVGQITNILLNQEGILKSYEEAESVGDGVEAADCNDDDTITRADEDKPQDLKLQLRQAKINLLGKVMYEYIQRALYHNVPFDMENMLMKAEEVKDCLAIQNFMATSAWLDDFKKAFGIEDLILESLRKRILITEVKLSSLDAFDMVRYISQREKARSKCQAISANDNNEEKIIDPASGKRQRKNYTKNKESLSNCNIRKRKSLKGKMVAARRKKTNQSEAVKNIRKGKRGKSKLPPQEFALGSHTDDASNGDNEPMIVYELIDDEAAANIHQISDSFVIEDRTGKIEAGGNTKCGMTVDMENSRSQLHENIEEVITYELNDNDYERPEIFKQRKSNSPKGIAEENSFKNRNLKSLQRERTSIAKPGEDMESGIIFKKSDNKSPQQKTAIGKKTAKELRTTALRSKTLKEAISNLMASIGDDEINQVREKGSKCKNDQHCNQLNINENMEAPSQFEGRKESRVLAENTDCTKSTVTYNDVHSPKPNLNSQATDSLEDNEVKIKIETEEYEFIDEVIPDKINTYKDSFSPDLKPMQSDYEFIDELIADKINKPQNSSFPGRKPAKSENNNALNRETCRTPLTDTKVTSNCLYSASTASVEHQKSNLPRHDIHSLEEALSYLQALSHYATLKENYLAVGLLTQLEEVFKKPPC